MLLNSLNQAQKEAFICLAHNVVVSDGELTVGERVMMDDMRREMDLPLAGIEKIFDTRRSRIVALISLIRLGYADGAFEIEEQCLLSDLCTAFEVSDADFAHLQNWVRRLIALEREAQAFM